LDFSAIDQPAQTINSIHLWHLDLSELNYASCANLISILSPPDLDRARQFKFRHLQERHILSRIFLRLCLSHYTDTAPDRLQFICNAHGKPRLCDARQDAHFNLSHAGNLVCVAVSFDSEIGLDIETRSDHDFLNIAAQFFHPDEYQQLREAHSHERERMFYRLWTMKEAFFKALGTGITAGLEKINIDLRCNPPKIFLAEDLPVLADTWTVFDTTLYDDTFLALAHQSRYSGLGWFNGLRLFK